MGAGREAELVGVPSLHAAEPAAGQRNPLYGLGELVDMTQEQLHNPHSEKGTSMYRIIILGRLALVAAYITTIVVYLRTY